MDQLDCTQFRAMLLSGAHNLANHEKEINTLNVFPVPDGDTGTNMNMTFSSGLSEIERQNTDHVDQTAKALSKGMLMGARGNSGVILSQIFKGIYKSVDGKDSLKTGDLAAAFENGSAVAYKAVMRPVEGTILTVVRESSQAAGEYLREHPQTDINGYFDVLCSQARESLKRTPDLLPVLKEANVVDSGGAGLVSILEGFQAYFQGRPVALKSAEQNAEEKKKALTGYQMEAVVLLNPTAREAFDPDRFTDSLRNKALEVNARQQGREVTLSLRTLVPGEILAELLRIGDPQTVNIVNLASPEEPQVEPEAPVEPYAIISVCNAPGIEQQFRDLGVHYFVKGGQTMNPSTEDFVSLVQGMHAEHIIILPNNGNIILAANQAREVLGGRDVTILPTKTIPQGLVACQNFDPSVDLDTNLAAMQEAIAHVKSGSVTNAVKDSVYNSVSITAGDFMAISGDEIFASVPDLMTAARTLLDTLIDEDSGLVMVLYGRQATEEQAQQLQNYVNDKYDIDCVIAAGGQDLYPFIVGVE